MTKVSIRQLPTRVPGLDQILGGGLPEFSFNLIVGSPGSGKTTLAHQIMFALATPERRAVYFTVVGEPPLKMLRYQQQYEFFDLERVGESIRFVSVGQDIVSGTLDQLLERIIAEVETTNPALVFVDSFRTVVQVAEGKQDGGLNLQSFVQQLAIRLTGWQATTFLIGEYQPTETEHDPVFTVADGLLWLHQSLDRNSMVRKIQVKKMRGQAPVPGLHTFRITDGGIDVFPRVIVGPSERTRNQSRKRLLLDIDELDEMLGGGIPEGYSVLVAGPSGSGKSVLATNFIMAGIRHDEPGVLAVFEKRPNEYSQTPPGGRAFGQMIRDGKVGVIHSRPLDLSIDETLYEIVEQVQRLKARRLVVDSLSGFELALAPTFREDFRESLYRMVAVLTGMGVTMMMTAELEDSYMNLRFSPHGTAFLTDVIIMQRYIELHGCLQRVMSVVKVRGSAHSKEIRTYEITKTGIAIGDPLPHYDGLLTGHPIETARVAPATGPRKRRGHHDPPSLPPPPPEQSEVPEQTAADVRAEFEALMEALREANGHLILANLRSQSLAEQMNQLYEEARSAIQAKDDFFSAISHELRSPLTSIAGWAQLLVLDSPDATTISEAARSIATSAALQAQLIDDLLDVSRIMTNKFAITEAKIDLRDVIEDSVSGMRPIAAAKDISLRKHVKQSVVIDGDPARLRQVLSNLLTNAIKFTPAGGLVETRLSRDGSFAVIEVSDTGEGISPAFLPHVFEGRSQATERRFAGLGLGLSIVKHIIELHRGSVEVRSEGEGKGATFTVRIPCEP